MTTLFAEQLNEIIESKSREEQFSGVVLVRRGEEEDGVSCRLYYYPSRNLDVVILGNQNWCAGSLAWEIHDLILKMDP